MPRGQIIVGQIDITVPAIMPTVAEEWAKLNSICIADIGQDNCIGLLGYKPVFFSPQLRPSIPKWALLFLGGVVGISLGRMFYETR
jgi:hypothetical protein